MRISPGCHEMIGHIQDLINLGQVVWLSVYELDSPLVKFEVEEWGFEDPFLKVDSYSFDMNLLNQLELEDAVLSLYFLRKSPDPVSDDSDSDNAGL